MTQKIKQIRKFNQRYKNFSFSELMNKADDEYLEFVLDMDEAGRLTTESKYLRNGELEEKNSFAYSAGDKITEHVLLHAMEDTTEKRVLRRNEKDLLLEEVKYYGDDSGERTEYHYDDKEQVTAILQYDEEGIHVGTEEIFYDDKGSIISRIQKSADGDILEVIRFEHNTDERSVVELTLDGSGDLQSRTVMTFDENGKELTSIQTSAAGKLISAVYSSYDEKGNLLERNYKDFYSKTVRNTYDDKGNLEVQELYDGNGLLLKKNMFSYNEEGQIMSEQTFELDTSRGGTDKHFGTRYEYDYYE